MELTICLPIETLTEKTRDSKYVLLKKTFGGFLYNKYKSFLFLKTVLCYEMKNYRIERQGKALPKYTSSFCFLSKHSITKSSKSEHREN